FEDVYRFDVAGIEHRERVPRPGIRTVDARVRPRLHGGGVNGHSIDDVERIVGGRDGGAAADSDGHPGAWLTVVLDDGNARNAALDEILRCGDLAHVGIGHAHRCHRAGDVTPALRTVPHDDHVFEFSDALAQGNIDDPLITYGNLLCLEADERKDEHGIGPRDRDGVITIQVRGRTDLGSLNGDVHSRKREARFSLRNATFDVDLLSSRYRSPKHHESAQAQIYSSVLG